MSIRDEIKMNSYRRPTYITFERDPSQPGNAEAQFERNISRIVTRRAAQLVKDGRGEREGDEAREWTEEEQRHIEVLRVYTNKCYPESEARQAIRWALSRLESLLNAQDDPIPHSTPTEAVAGTLGASSGKPAPPAPYHFRPHRVGMIDTVREDDPTLGRKVAYAGRTYAAVSGDDGRVYAVVEPPEDELLLLPPGSFQVTEWTAGAKEGGQS